MSELLTVRARLSAMRVARVVCAAATLLLTVGATGCSGTDDEDLLFKDLSDRDRLAVEVATSEQINLGRQIESVSQSDNAYELCFEICRRAKDSCSLSTKVCDIGVKYPKSIEVGARCDVTRERCRAHRAKVPRICTCPE